MMPSSPYLGSALVFLLCLNLVTATSAVSEYFLGVRHRSDPTAFESWVRSRNNHISYRRESNGDYVANLTQSQHDEVRALPFILFVLPHEVVHQPIWVDDPEPVLADAGHFLQPRQVSTVATDVRQFKFISNRETGVFNDNWQYTRDDSGGRGVTLYIFDSGFNLDLEEIRGNGDREIRTYYVPNGNVQAASSEWEIMDASINDNQNHGTKSTVAAAGKTYGVAPNADLFLIKACVDTRHIKTGQVRCRNTIWGLRMAFQYIQTQINEDADKKKHAKEVFKPLSLMATGLKREFSDIVDSEVAKFFQEFLDHLASEGGLVVAAASYAVQGTLGDWYPAALGTSSNNLVTVGGVYLSNGYLDLRGAPQQAGSLSRGKTGSLTVYGPTFPLYLMDNQGNLDTNADGGTSAASAFTAGLAAYYLGIDKILCGTSDVYDDLNLYNNKDLPVASKLKSQLVKSAFQRRSKVLSSQTQVPNGYNVPSTVKAIYNWALGSPQ
ncbi:subtilisin-like protein [Penicillium hispanicum]|uniref:subtilisin-like protein n=1 Tax=Penicillium hispanicum TaxID=1080232 RepID=UPI0025425366|nr:subtilisin-like protein [Penicillium hispanicum]KAJ5586841.1 subtilisin-like protein [Penicillium hispanicum]